MRQKERLQHQHDEFNQRWKNQSETLSRLQEAYDNETRTEEKIRLEPILQDKQKQREQVEQQLQALEAEIKQQDLQEIIGNA
ncbi:MAG: hypothetical protein DSZ29_03380, partial [Aquificaceae bacterium]